MAAEEVADHYNKVRQEGIGNRTESRIYYQRNLSNWIKSQLIDEAVKAVGRDSRPRVLDLACGKGGDLRKWKIARASSVVLADIAEVSIDQAKQRYDEFSARDRDRDPWFQAQFVTANCCEVDLATLITNPAPFDIVSCQFALHYSFIDESSARQFLRNATQSLRPGGYFIGTLPDAERIVWAARQSDGDFKNAVCSVRFENKEELNGQPPLFGSKFWFGLDDQVNCPEFLAYFPLLEHLLEDMDMELVFKHRFPDAIEKWKVSGRQLLGRMQAAEPYPAAEGVRQAGLPEEYQAAVEFLATLDPSTARPNESVGTLSKSEWEAVCMYLVFAFRKKGGLKEEKKEEVKEETKEEVKEETKEEAPKEDEAAQEAKQVEEELKEPEDDDEVPAKMARTE